MLQLLRYNCFVFADSLVLVGTFLTNHQYCGLLVLNKSTFYRGGIKIVLSYHLYDPVGTQGLVVLLCLAIGTGSMLS